MRLWVRYLREKRVTIVLCLLTAAVFVTVGSLYHIENLEKLLYAALLASVIWGTAGFLRGMEYVRRSAQLEETARHFEQSGELLLGEWNPGDAEGGEESLTDAESLADAQGMLMLLMRETYEKERHQWERRSAEYKDYYVMWTHQVKTPISAMKLLLEESGISGRESFLMREELFKIEQYVEMVLTFQRLDSIASDLVLQEYDLYTLVKQAVKKYAVLFINKNLSLDLQEQGMELKIVTDEKWFVFCLEQFLSNSIKYTAKGSITVSAEKEGSQEAGLYDGKPSVRGKLCIRDTGIGIRAEDLPRIFEKGFTGCNGRMDKRSTGIGLYLCRQILSHLGITVKVESEEGQGTRVVLSWEIQEKAILR